ncbi:MAG: hypothetical protein JNM93_12685 [Bacteriovoracaceae bacterium]|nr:hypothetical protein [Bacteriovoracaceae bacterium]
MSDLKKIRLLNLSGVLSSRLNSFFTQNNVEVIFPELLDNIKNINFILVKDWVDFATLEARYQPVENGITVISLSGVKDAKDFLLTNGRIIIDETWLDNKVGQILLQKIFQKAGTIHLDEMFGSEFKEYQTCKIASHLRLGHYSDIISLDAFENDYNIVAIRGFLYHVIYYFTYLKQAGIGGVPFDVEYTSNSQFFVVNVHMSVKNFVAEYLLDCFGEDNTTDPLKYLLKTASKLADNMDVTYIENPAKLVITGIWRKVSEDRVYRYSTLLLNNIKTSKQIIDEVERTLAAVNVIEGNPEVDARNQTLDGKLLPGNLVAMVLNHGDPNSAVNKSPEKAASVMAFVASAAEEMGKKPEELTPEEFESILEKHLDQSFIDELSPSDKKHLMERLQKKNIAEAYGQEVQRVQQQLDQTPEHVEKIKEDYAEKISEKIASVLDIDTLNEIISNPIDLAEENKTVVRGKYDLDLDLFQVPEASNPLNSDENKVSGEVIEEGDNVRIKEVTEKRKDGKDGLNGSIFDEDEIRIGGGDEDDEGEIKVKGGENEVDENGVRIKDVTERKKDDITNVKGGEREEDENNLVKGSKEDAEDLLNVGGAGEGNADDSAINIAGTKDEKEARFNVGGSPLDIDTSNATVNGVTDTIGDNKAVGRLSGDQKKDLTNMLGSAFNAVTQALGSSGFAGTDFPSVMNMMRQHLMAQPGMDPQLAEIVMKSAEHFMQQAFSAAGMLNKAQPQELSADYLNEFKKKKFPNLVEAALGNIVVNNEPQAPVGEVDLGEQFKKKLKSQLVNNLGNYLVDENGNPKPLTAEDFNNPGVQKNIKAAIQNIFSQELTVIPASDVDKYQQLEEQIVKSLADILPLDEEMLRQIAEQAKGDTKSYEMGTILDSLFTGGANGPLELSGEDGVDNNIVGNGSGDFSQTAIIQKLKQFEAQNKKLKADLQRVQIDSEAKGSTIKQLQNIAREAKMAQVKLSKDIPKREELMSELKREQLKKEILDNSNLSEEDKKMVNKALEREKKLFEITKKAELELRKFQIEARQKDSKFQIELDQANRNNHSKDVVLKKAKEQLESVVKRKDIELAKLNERLNEINKETTKGDDSKQIQELKKLEKENQNLQRMVDVYKKKINDPSFDIDLASPKNTNDEAKAHQEQIKHLETVKKKLEQKLLNYERNATKLNSKLKEQSDELASAASSKEKAEDELRKVSGETKILRQNLIQNQTDVTVNKNVNKTETEQAPGFTAMEKMNLQAKLNDAEKRAKELEGKVKLYDKKIEEGQKAIQEAKNLTVRETQLKKDLFAANRKLETMQEKLKLVERKADFKNNEVIGNEEHDAAKIQIEEANQKHKEYEDKIKKLAKELQKSLLEQFKQGKKAGKEGDSSAELKANEAKLKLQLMDSAKKMQSAEAKIKSLEKQLEQVSEGAESAQDLDEMLNNKNEGAGNKIVEQKLKKELEKSINKTKTLQEKMEKLEADYNQVLAAAKTVNDPSQNLSKEKQNANNILEAKLRDQLKNSSSQLKEYQTLITDYEKKLKAAQEEIKNSKNSANTGDKNLASMEAKFKSDLLAANRKNSELTQKIKELEKKNTQTEMARQKSLDDVKRLANENAANNEKNGTFGAEETVKLRFELQGALRKNINLETQIARLEKQAKDATDKIMTANTQSKNANKEVAALEAKFKQEVLIGRRQINDSENKIKELEKRIQELTGGQDGGTGQGEPELNMAKFKQMEANSRKLMQEMSKTKSMFAQQKQDLAKAKAEAMGLQNKVQTLEKELAKAQIILKNLKKGGGKAA